ncbi:MAG: hypothetical protein JXQ73_15900 [Phycisphaerae bacterium]|nr:hypothetical protein [Phycisphaerae bacterium]
MLRPTAAILCILGATATDATAWQRDFRQQPIENRPRLEVRYTDGTRTAFEIEAQAYHLIGELRGPHRLLDAATGKPWLSLAVEDAGGKAYSSQHNDQKSRINLYRRGPYYCEIHWLDVRVGDETGKLAPLKGDLALYCYPDKILASITWHAIEDFNAKKVRVDGMVEKAFDAGPLAKKTKLRFAFPLFGEHEPLPDAAFENLSAVAPMRYDPVRGCYTIGSLSKGGFQGHFYHHPNRYETVRFRVKNDGGPRTIFVCHENTGGDKGTVEGGVLLDDGGHPLPMVVQISKNFAGEKEEKFYNPKDTPFSETYFPLHLEAGEARTVTSLHLYQNWGRHMVKQFSSLGAWMDYFHSSTGVTETTCYVPFKFAGLSGVDIADFRAMSQASFWGGQPQHDNVAGHSYLSYKAGETWQHLVYRGTTYRSTGPNWMDIGLAYQSTDGKIRATVRTMELPQADELRNFVHVRYEVLEPVTITDAKLNCRLLTAASWVQRLRYKRFAATGIEDRTLEFKSDHAAVRGLPLPRENAFIALYGEPKGSNAFILQSWSARIGGAEVAPAASVWCEKSGDTRLLLVPDAETVSLSPGDLIEFRGFWMPYGQVDSAETPRREAICYGSKAPRVVDVIKGSKIADFPPTVRAEANGAEFVLRGGRDLVPVIVTGLTDYRWPRLYRREGQAWKASLQSRVGDLDGAQVFAESNDRFGAVFLVASDDAPQRLRVQAGQAPRPAGRITVRPLPATPDGVMHAALIKAPWMRGEVSLRFPETVNTDTLDFIDHHRDDMPPRVPSAPLAKIWQTSEGGSMWFEWTYDNQVVGGRLSPNEDDVDLEFWLGNKREKAIPVAVQFCSVLAKTMFEDHELKRSWIHTAGRWRRMAETDRGGGKRSLCHYPLEGGPPVHDGNLWGGSKDVVDAPVAAVTSKDGKHVFAIAWPKPRSILSNADIPCVHADPVWPDCPPGRRVYVRGKIYLIEGTLEDVIARVRREILAPATP